MLDGVEDTAHRLVSYRSIRFRRHMITLAEIVASCAAGSQGALSARARTADHGALHRDQPAGERRRPIGRAAVVDLFDKEKDPITLIKLKEVYEFFEKHHR